MSDDTEMNAGKATAGEVVNESATPADDAIVTKSEISADVNENADAGIYTATATDSARQAAAAVVDESATTDDDAFVTKSEISADVNENVDNGIHAATATDSAGEAAAAVVTESTPANENNAFLTPATDNATPNAASPADSSGSPRSPAPDRDIHTLRVSSLYKTFGKKQVVKGVDFSMQTGEVLGLLGPNGAGKTTTFYMIVGFHKPTSGGIFLDDQHITGLPMYKRARLGISYLPQEPSVFRKLTVEENIWSILETRRDLKRKQKLQKLEELIEEFSIGHIRKQYAFTLSGGERRRTEIARSLAIEPKFLLLDEPFAGIDPIAVADIKGMIKLLAKRGIGILITDHNVRDTLEITDRAIIVSTGQILIQGTKQEIIDSPVAREIYLGEGFHM